MTDTRNDRPSGEGEGALGRWSRRKQTAREAEPAVPDDDAAAGADPAPGDAAPSAIDPDDLPDIDELEADSDFTVFMQDGVPEALRNRALRKLWTTDPVLANLDGLNDYDDDFGAILRAGAEEMRKLAELIDEKTGATDGAEKPDTAETAASEAKPAAPVAPEADAGDATRTAADDAPADDESGDTAAGEGRPAKS